MCAIITAGRVCGRGRFVYRHAFGRGAVKALAFALAGLGLAGCSLFSGTPPETYDLAAPADVSEIGGSTSAQILVPESTALAAFDSERIVVASDTLITYYPDAQWPDRLPRVIQARVIETLERSGGAQAAGRPGQGLSIDYQLLTDIRVFQYEVDAEGATAVVEIFAQVMDDRNGRIIATRSFSASRPVAEDTAAAVTAALEAALAEVLVDLASWTLARI